LLVLLLPLLGIACDPVARLHGTVRAPTENGAANFEQPVEGASVVLACPRYDELRPVGEPSPARTDAQGEWNTYAASFDTPEEMCHVRVKKDGYEPLDEALSALPHQVGPEVRTMHVQVRLKRARAEGGK
jgi:hypothetical protein